MSSKFRSVILIVLGLALCASSASAQNVYASVTGTVSDPQANPMPGVKVTATNTGTALVRTAITDAHGVYLLKCLAGGDIQRLCEHPGVPGSSRQRYRVAG